MVMLEPTIHAVCLLLLWNFCDGCGLLQNVKRNVIFSEQNLAQIEREETSESP